MILKRKHLLFFNSNKIEHITKTPLPEKPAKGSLTT